MTWRVLRVHTCVRKGTSGPLEESQKTQGKVKIIAARYGDFKAIKCQDG